MVTLEDEMLTRTAKLRDGGHSPEDTFFGATDTGHISRACHQTVFGKPQHDECKGWCDPPREFCAEPCGCHCHTAADQPAGGAA